MVEALRSTEYNLKWNSHHSTIISMMDYLLERESLTDVTLAAEGKFINVHRFMLFACSPYFEELLTQQPEKQAIIFLKDVSFANLQALVQFMYKGEVLVPEEQLGSFCQTAVSLKIKGLLFCDKEESIKVQSKPVMLQSENTMPPSKKRAMSPQNVMEPKFPRSPSKSIKISSLQSIAPVESAEPIETEEPEFIDMQEEASIEFDEPVEKNKITNRSEAPSFSGTLKQIDKTVEYVFAEKKLKQLKTHSSDLYESDPDAESEELEASYEYEKKWGSGDDSNAQDDDLEIDYSQHEAYASMNEDEERPSRQLSRKSKSSLSNGKSRSRRYSPGTPMHVCGKCGRSYSYKGSLLNHMSECGKKS